ncbi:hypothetical protein ABXS75_07940 [Roseburia hominis]
MSQEKVDRYKQEKANRKQIIKKQRRAQIIRNCVTAFVIVVLLGWLGYSAYGLYEQKQPREVAEVDYKAMNDYLQSLDFSAEE